MERFSTCWADEDKPYLQPLADTPHHLEGGDCFCNTDDKEILGQVLNNYDQETTDFYRWSIEYTRQEISELIGRRSGVQIGTLVALEPMLRGESGRLYRMRVKGTDRTMVVGKELEIRRILSESHLKSSAFEVVYLDEKGGVTGSDGEWKAVRLDGRGWGHGVGLCQIGAAVIASEGYDYISILNHYYPGADVENK
jgi:SpoIID/LytB domain protein